MVYALAAVAISAVFISLFGAVNERDPENCILSRGNVRLFDEIQDKSRRRLTASQDRCQGGMRGRSFAQPICASRTLP